MTPLQRAGYLAHSRTAGFARRVDAARATIAEGLRLCRAPYVSWSAGKDSSALLWLVAEHWPDADVRVMTWWDTRLVHAEFDALVAWWRGAWPALRWMEVREGYEPDADGEVRPGASREYGPHHGHLKALLYEVAACDGAFVGLRAAEAGNRAGTLRWHRCHDRHPIFRYAPSAGGAKAGAYRICPLAGWSVADVGALHARHGLPLLRAYDAGLNERTTLRLDEIAVSQGAVAKLRQRDPAAYRALAARLPIVSRET